MVRDHCAFQFSNAPDTGKQILMNNSENKSAGLPSGAKPRFLAQNPGVTAINIKIVLALEPHEGFIEVRT